MLELKLLKLHPLFKLARVTSIGKVMVIGACAVGPFLGGSAIQGLGLQGAIIFFLILVAAAAIVASGTEFVGRGHWLAELRRVLSSGSQASPVAIQEPDGDGPRVLVLSRQ